jgi:hypothetical protein
MSRERKIERMEIGKEISDALFGNAFHRRGRETQTF